MRSGAPCLLHRSLELQKLRASRSKSQAVLENLELLGVVVVLGVFVVDLQVHVSDFCLEIIEVEK